MFYDESDNAHVINLQLQPSTVQSMKPCPFCGHKPKLANTHTAKYWLECGGCGMEIHDVRSVSGKTMRAHRASAGRVVQQWQSRMGAAPVDCVAVPLQVAYLVRKVFLPHNPRKMRKPHPDVLDAATRFIALVEKERQ